MALPANTALTFQGYQVTDPGTRLDFLAADPGPGQSAEVSILLTDADLATVTTQVQLRNLVTSRLQRKVRAAGIAAKLDQFIGQSVTV